MRNNYAWCLGDKKYAEINIKKNPKHIDEELEIKNEDLDENKINIEPAIFLQDDEEGIIEKDVTLSKLQQTQQNIIEKGCNIGLNFEKTLAKLASWVRDGAAYYQGPQEGEGSYLAEAQHVVMGGDPIY